MEGDVVIRRHGSAQAPAHVDEAYRVAVLAAADLDMAWDRRIQADAEQARDATFFLIVLIDAARRMAWLGDRAVANQREQQVGGAAHRGQFAEPFGEIGAALIGGFLQPVMQRRQVERAVASGDRAALGHAGEEFIAAQFLADLARLVSQLGDDPVEAFQGFIEAAGIDAGAALDAFEYVDQAIGFLQELGFEVAAGQRAGGVEDRPDALAGAPRFAAPRVAAAGASGASGGSAGQSGGRGSWSAGTSSSHPSSHR